MKRNLLLLSALMAVLVAQADKDVYLGRVLYHCFDETMTAEVRQSPYHDTNEMDVVVQETVEADGKTYTVTSIGDQAFTYTLNSLSLPNTIRRIGKQAFYKYNLTSVVLPAQLETIGEEAFYGAQLESLAIPEGVKEIGKAAFSNCISLQEVKLPSTLERIGDYAFNFCLMLSSIELPASLKSLGKSAFQSCKSLTALSLPDGIEELGSSVFSSSGLKIFTIPSTWNRIPDGFFESTKISEIVIPKGVREIGAQAFNNCTKLTSISIPEGITDIPNEMLSNCRSLTSVQLPSTVKYIGDWAFSRAGITDITLPEGLKSIGYSAFRVCPALTELVIPQSVERVGAMIVNSCTALQTLKLPQSLDILEGRLDCLETTHLETYGEGNALEITETMMVNNRRNGSRVLLYAAPEMAQEGVLTIPDGITAIGKYALDGYVADKIILPEGLDTIFSCAASEVTAKEIVLPSTLRYMGENAFSSAAQLESVVIPESIEEIPQWCFSGCIALSSVVLPQTLKVLAMDCFMDCSSLMEISLPEGLLTLGTSALSNTGITELVIPNSCTSFNLFGLKNMKKVTLPAGLKELPSQAFSELLSLETVTLPEGITTIPYWTFYRCSSLKTVVIPNSVKRIEEQAFHQSGIESIVLPESVEEIGPYTFYQCENLESITVKSRVTSLPLSFCQDCPKLQYVSLPEGLENIGRFAFLNCTSLTECLLPSTLKGLMYASFALSGLKSISIPDAIEHIGEFSFESTAMESANLSNISLESFNRGLFANCESLNDVTLPASLKLLADYNFAGCTSLTSVTSLAQVPPVAEPFSFDDAAKTSTTLYVPSASLTAYQSADVWKDFFAVKDLSTTGISMTTATDSVRDIYDLSGRKTSKPVKGLNIVRMNSGRNQVMIKK